MNLFFSKILTQLAMPLGIGSLLILVGVGAVVFGRRRLGIGCSLAGLFWIWLCAMPVFSNWLCLSLEGGYPPVAVESLPSAGAIVVLGGAMESVRPPDLYPNLGAGADRVWHTARLYHAGKAPLIVASGGRLPWTAGSQPEAEAIVQFLGDLGVPRGRVLAEGSSQTTFGNAQETQQLLVDKGIAEVLLVTSALHMRRAEATFRAAGIRVIAAPTDYESLSEPRWTVLDYLPDAAALERSSRAFKEYLGLWVYQARGWAVP